MGCAGCSTTANGKPNGCKSNGSCLTGGCNRLNTFDWLTQMDIHDPLAFQVVEVSFKNGARKDFFHHTKSNMATTGDLVVVDVGGGYDIGQISLSGELVRMQMKKKNIKDTQVMHPVVRKAHTRDLEKLSDARSQEKRALVRARVISRTLGLDMKIGDVEYRGDNRKATFYYTAEGRIDFRELVRQYAKEFRVKIEMRQIGARQESARIGGLGSCGRELCCSTWLTDFKSVTTNAARYQNISINQSKLSGQCGRLKCCLNYELDTYMDALKEFPKNIDKLYAEHSEAHLIKTDIFKRLLYYSIRSEHGRGIIVPIALDRVKEIKEMNKRGERPPEFGAFKEEPPKDAVRDEDEDLGFADVTGQIELPNEKKRRSKRRRPKRRGNSRNNQSNNSRSNQKEGPADKKSDQKEPQNKSGNNRPSNQRRRPNRNKPNRNKSNQNRPNQNNPNQKNDKDS